MDTGWISDRRSRGAWVGAAAYFLLTGVIFATWASRVPAIKGGLNLGEGQFAIALLGLEAGAVLGLQLGGLLVPRVGSRRVLTASLVAFACALSGLAFAPGLPLLAASLFAFAALNSVVDVAMNTQGLAFQRLMGRPVLSRLHAMHSLGGVLGAGGNAPGETPATAAARVSTLGYLGSFVGPALVGAWRACPACPAGPSDGFRGEGGQAGRIECPRGKR